MTTIDPRRIRAPSTPGRVFLVRHGRTSLNADVRLRGRLDPPLDDVGARSPHWPASSPVHLAHRQPRPLVIVPLTPAAEGPLPWQDHRWCEILPW